MESRKTSLTPSICFVTIHSFPDIGGGEERFLERYSSYLEKRGIRFVIVSSTIKDGNPNVVGVGVKQFKLPLAGSTPYLMLFSLMACLRIISLNRRYKFSLIHSIDTGYAGLAGLLASKILDLKFVVHSHCSRARLVTLTLALRSDFFRHVISLYQKSQSLIDRLVLTNADEVIAINREIGYYASSLGVPAEKILVNPVGLDASALECKENDRDAVFREFGISPNSFVIGYLGSLQKAKGTDTLVEAFALLQRETKGDSFLLIVGDGDRDDLERKVRERKLSSVIFTGYRKDIAKVLAAMDVFVLPSLSEGCPFSLLEAMTAEKAIIVSDIPSVREIVKDGNEALLFDPRNAKMLKDKIFHLYSDSELRKQLGINAKKKSLQYSSDAVYGKIIEAYRNLR